MNRVPSLSILLLLSCHAAPAPVTAPVPTPPPTPPAPVYDPISASVNATMDRSVDACTDFYQYACGGWLKTEQRPADQVAWYRSFSVIDERNVAEEKLLLEDAAAGKPSPEGRTDDADWQKLGGYYASCMDEPAIEQAGSAPIAAQLALVSSVKDMKSLMTVLGTLNLAGVAPLFDTYVDADPKNPDLDILYVSQGGLGLPDRDYYLGAAGKGLDADGTALLGKYQAHVAKMLALAGDKNAEKEAAAIVAFETQIAKLEKERDELRDPEKTYHKIDAAGLQKLTPKLPWGPLFAAVGFPKLQDITVDVPELYTGLGTLVAKTDLNTLRAYLRWNVVHAAAPSLAKAYVDENFAFFAHTLRGQAEMRPRWKRCVDSTDGALGEALGRFYVAKDFPGDSKAQSVQLIQGIETAFEENLPKLAWMDDATRTVALAKARAVTNKIGYPDSWRDYGTVTVDRAKYFANTLSARAFETRRVLGKVGGPVDKKEWGMTPPTVNAYYNPSNNEIAFPAGILQSPFFDRAHPAAMNFGAIGMVMGHELTHGFDDEGRKFDATGRMAPWWSDDVAKKFEAQTQCVVDQYSAYQVQPDVHVNGALTLGENIADLGGIKEAFHAYQAWAAANPDKANTPLVENLTNEQLYFVGFAQSWCALETPEYEKEGITVDPHSPPRFRVNGPLSDFPEFAKAFGCAAGTPMAPANACTVW